jgi:hypothetical protein
MRQHVSGAMKIKRKVTFLFCFQATFISFFKLYFNLSNSHIHQCSQVRFQGQQSFHLIILAFNSKQPYLQIQEDRSTDLMGNFQDLLHSLYHELFVEV